MKRILEKVFRKRERPLNMIERYIKEGNLVVGKNSEIQKLNICIFGAQKGILNIEIGDECMLEGDLYLYTPHSKIKFGNRVFLAGRSSLYSFEEIEVGNDTMISWGCTLIDTNAHSLDSNERKNDVINWKKGWEYKDWSVVESKKVKIGAKSWLGFNSIILKGTELGEGCIVAAGSVVSKSFDAYSVIGGNPGEFIKRTI